MESHTEHLPNEIFKVSYSREREDPDILKNFFLVVGGVTRPSVDFGLWLALESYMLS